MHSGRVLSSEMYYVRLTLGCKGGGGQKKLSAPASETEGSCGGWWSKVSNHSNGPRVLMRPVYLVVMDLFAAQTNPSTPPPPRLEGILRA